MLRLNSQFFSNRVLDLIGPSDRWSPESMLLYALDCFFAVGESVLEVELFGEADGDVGVQNRSKFMF